MPTPKKGPRLGGSPAHQRLILSNLATQLFEHGRITTTESRARTLRPYAEKLITKAKKGDLHNRREVLKTVRDKSVVHTLFTEIAPTLLRASRWLHPDHQDRSAQGRQRPHGGHRARDRALLAQACVEPRRPLRLPLLRPRPPRRLRSRRPRPPTRPSPRRLPPRRRPRRPPTAARGRGVRGVRGAEGRLSVPLITYDGPSPRVGGGPSSSARQHRPRQPART